MIDLRVALEANFGHAEFRPYQEEIIRQVMAGQDTLGVLPTGAGKSLCYQLPALLLPRPTLVISPLIALMQDQLDGLPSAVSPQATFINSSLDQDEIKNRLEDIEAGKYRLIYVAPERLRQQEFLRLLQHVGLSLVVIDEAHCISMWGLNFRPDYLFIREVLKTLTTRNGRPAVLALTATATTKVQTEIGKQLGRELQPVNAPLFRSNLRIEVFPCDNADAKTRQLVTVCRETQGAGIVYAESRDRCEQLAGLLNELGISAAFYHARSDSQTRRETQERFMLGKVRVLVATVAFGMGINKHNVRFVVHYAPPTSMEEYMPEVGRAGHDSRLSRCILLYSARDEINLNNWKQQYEVTLLHVQDTYRALNAHIRRGTGFVSLDEIKREVLGEEANAPQNATQIHVAISMLERCGLVEQLFETGYGFQFKIPDAPPTARAELDVLLESRKEHEESRLADVISFMRGGECRHVALSRHFDQMLPPCGDACDHCRGTAPAISVQAAVYVQAPTFAQVPDVGRVILDCLASLPFPLGRTGIAKVLSGAADSPVPASRCRNHGALAGFTLKSLRGFLDTLVTEELLRLNQEGDYPLLALTRAGRDALDEESEILANPLKTASKSASKNAQGTRNATYTTAAGNTHTPQADVPYDADEDDRFEKLRAWRRIEADRQNLPPYVIFHDATLRAIAQTNPADLDGMKHIPGIGPRKLETYGEAVISLLHGAETSSASISQ